MALRKRTDYMGVTLTDAYWRISGFVFTSKTNCRAYMELHSDQTVANSVPNTPINTIVVDFDYDFNNTQESLHTQAYNAAKLMPEFEDATDV